MKNNLFGNLSAHSQPNMPADLVFTACVSLKQAKLEPIATKTYLTQN